MKKFLLMLPLVAILISSCSEGYSLEQISSYCVTELEKYEIPSGESIGVLSADGGKITISVTSTHSYVMNSDPAGVFEFTAYGVVNFSQEGVALIETWHEVQVNPNTTGKPREVRIMAKQRHNPEMVTSILFYQPAQE